MRAPVAVITGTGSYAPSRVMTNDEFAAYLDTSDIWIRERTGIRERRIAAPEEATSDLAVSAAGKALDAAGLSASEIDGILLATATPDLLFPSTACLVQARLGADNAFAFDLNAVCSGFVYAMSVAKSMIESKAARRLLVIGSEVMSRTLDWSDRGTCILFGDGAGAVVVEASTTAVRGLETFRLRADGRYWEMIHVPAGGSRRSGTEVAPYIRMKGGETFKMAVRSLQESVMEVLSASGISPGEIDLLVPHQANIRIIDALASRLGLPSDKVVVNIEHYGNTSAASVPVALDEAVRAGRVKEGSRILLTAFGAGVTWGSGLLTWEAETQKRSRA
ncbi:MAG: ketoacyl-ACP synthase III [Nitrospirae bacterium]|nr:ketoacyl-ACP synthase III [Nitrospirota bacterium]MCL5284695.1 ketoacyl-ACP synthase III [Nitrospirota bacterium]